MKNFNVRILFQATVMVIVAIVIWYFILSKGEILS
jgi:hypothetical protein